MPCWRNWRRAKATGKSLSGFSPIPRRRVRRGKSKWGLLSWKSADRTATRKHSRSLPNTWASFPKPAKTSKLVRSHYIPRQGQFWRRGVNLAATKTNEDQKKEKQKR